MIRSKVTITWNHQAIEKVKRDAMENVRRRMEAVTCPVHGTRVKVVFDRMGTAQSTEGFCCDRLKQALEAAIR